MLAQGVTSLPALQTADGLFITQTPAILTYLAHGHSLLGSTAMEQAQVDQWMLIIRLETWPLLKTLAAFVYGEEECNT